MAKYFDEKVWSQALQKPDWYLRLFGDYQRLMRLADENPSGVAESIKEEVYRFLEERLMQGMVALASDGPNRDAERKAIDTVVVHHTKNPSGITWQRLSVMHLIRLYAPYYRQPSSEEGKIAGQAIYSHHFRNGQPVFYAYHWLVRMDGQTERLLNDHEIGWQAGDWDINCRSMALCLDNDFTYQAPSEKVLQAIADLINRHYRQVTGERILGHREVNQKTTCPGNMFLTGWKEVLLQKVQEAHRGGDLTERHGAR